MGVTYPTILDCLLRRRTLIEEIHLFGYPRCGSHFLIYCLAGLYDLRNSKESYPQLDAEVATRPNELDPQAVYALGLREEGAISQPLLWVNALPNGVHGIPVVSANRRFILIREPQATIYSLYRVNRDRWGGPVSASTEATAWIEERLTDYQDFYRHGFAVRDADPAKTCVVRYEELSASPMALSAIAAFIGKPTKLSPEFIFWVTNFRRFTLAGAERTFYRAGDNTAYLDDPLWQRLTSRIDPARWAGFGYAGTPERSGGTIGAPT